MNSNGSSATLPNDSNLLTLKQIASSIGCSYDRLNGFAQKAGVRTAVGAVDVAGVKGVRYPPEAQELFALLIKAQDEGLVHPGTSEAFLARTQQEESNGQIAEYPKGNGQGQIARLTKGGENAESLVRLMEAAIELTAQRIAAQVLPPPEDRLIRAEEAAALLACKARAVGRYVKPARPGVWKRSAILSYIQSLT